MTKPADAYQAAHDAYLAEHPEPQAADFRCWRCGAGVGVPCSWPGYQRTEYHIAREERRLRAANKRIVAAIDAGERAEQMARS